MGLDMYLQRTHYVPDYVNGQSGARKNNLYAIQGINVDPAKVSSVIEQVGYWRKANQIHSWFVENVQGGVDDCGTYYVDTANVEALLDVVNEVLDNSILIDGEVINGYTYNKEGGKTPNLEKGKIIEDSSIAQKLLPTNQGFFFGSTEYDEYYYQDLVYTKTILEEILAREEVDAYYYHSSW